jgi:hypothetical protein
MAGTKATKNDTTANLGFEAKHAELASQESQGADPENPDEYRSARIFWAPKETPSRQQLTEGRAAERLRPRRPRG